MHPTFVLRLIIHWILLLVPNLLTQNVCEAQKPVCNSSEYGQPNLASCFALLYGGKGDPFSGITNLDYRDHAFLLPYFGQAKDFTPEQWSNKFYMPVIWEDRESSHNSKRWATAIPSET